MKIKVEKLKQAINRYWSIKQLADRLWVHRQSIMNSFWRGIMLESRLKEIVRVLNILEEAEVKINNGFITKRLKYKVEDFIEKD